jgi:hypothetical protein
MGWAHLPLKHMPTMPSAPAFHGSSRRLFTLNPLGLGNNPPALALHLHCSDPSPQATGTTPCRGSRPSLLPKPPPPLQPTHLGCTRGRSSCQRFLVVCVSRDAHANQVPGICILPATPSAALLPLLSLCFRTTFFSRPFLRFYSGNMIQHYTGVRLQGRHCGL